MNTDRLVLLGTKGGPSLRVPDRMPTSSLLVIGGKTCIVDCGLGVTRSAVKAGVSLSALDIVVITHLHSDHLIELGPLIHTSWTSGLTRRLPILGPPGIREYLDKFFESMRYDIDLRIDDEGRNDIRELVKVREIGEGKLEVDGVNIAVLRVKHPPVTDCFALRFDVPGWSVTFSADTARFPPLAEFAKGSDILVHEAMLAEGVDWIVSRTANASRLREHLVASHTEVADVLEIAEIAEVDRLVLHHLIPVDAPGIDDGSWNERLSGYRAGKVTVAHDGLEILRKQGRTLPVIRTSGSGAHR